MEEPDRDPGDAVPPSAAVRTPEKLGESDENVQEKLEHLIDQTKTPG